MTTRPVTRTKRLAVAILTRTTATTGRTTANRTICTIGADAPSERKRNKRNKRKSAKTTKGLAAIHGLEAVRGRAADLVTDAHESDAEGKAPDVAPAVAATGQPPKDKRPAFDEMWESSSVPMLVRNPNYGKPNKFCGTDTAKKLPNKAYLST